MGLWSDRLLPRLIDLGMGSKVLRAERPLCAGEARGRVLELGFGSGHNLPFYGEGVQEIVAVEPSALARRLSEGRRAASAIPVRFAELEGERLALPDASFDEAVCTWTLCTVPDPLAALHEVRRVLRPGGALRFIEHGLSSDPGVARWQRRLTPLQRRWAGNCHLDRPIDRLVRTAGFELSELATYYAEGPRPMTYFYRGVGRAPG